MLETLNMLWNILLIAIGFGVLIFVHELGHFLAAKWAGIRTEGFAIGMGPVVASWRKGIGLRLGSTHNAVVERTGRAAHQLSEEELRHYNLGETEYSLRWLPIGGFVKMLGQEDANPNAVSDDPRSYTQCPIGKRMVVVSAGVIMNVILAAILFIIAFMVGVKFEAPVLGVVAREMPAGTTAAQNAETIGIEQVGLQPGDRVLRINDDDVETFADIQIATAMAKPGETLRFDVERQGVEQPLTFDLVPKKDENTGLLGIGVGPAGSSKLLDEDDVPDSFKTEFDSSGLPQAGVEWGMRLETAADREIQTYEQLAEAVAVSAGRPIRTLWTAVDKDGEPVGSNVIADLAVHPQYTTYRYKSELNLSGDRGLLGFAPLVRITGVTEKSKNRDVVRSGDVVLQIGDVHHPRSSQFRAYLGEHAGEEINAVMLRDDQPTDVRLSVSRDGLLGVMIQDAFDTLVTAEPIVVSQELIDGKVADVRTPIADADVFSQGGTRIEAINGTPVSDWASMRGVLKEIAADAAPNSEVQVTLDTVLPTPQREREQLTITLNEKQLDDLRSLNWSPAIGSYAFESISVVRSADGNPITALKMGVEETWKLIVMTYLTIDRLFRGSVGVEQLRGPVGIVHLGSKVVDRGFMYLLFFLAMISVNLAVINFLPLPIVDGGLFLFLLYEKLKGRPPSIAFQNAATIAGLGLIATAFLVVTWNDVMRLF